MTGGRNFQNALRKLIEGIIIAIQATSVLFVLYIQARRMWGGWGALAPPPIIIYDVIYKYDIKAFYIIFFKAIYGLETSISQKINFC